jgi:hypothetical protein
MRHNAAKAFVASAAFDGRLKALEERCSGDRATAQSGRGIEQMVQELRQQARWSVAFPQYNCRAFVCGLKMQDKRMMPSICMTLLEPCMWCFVAQVSSCCGATVKLGAEQNRLGRLLSTTANTAEMAEAKSDALAAEIARHNKILRRCRAQQENCHVSRSQLWKCAT